MDHKGHEAQHEKSTECPECVRMKRTAALGSTKGKVRVIRIQSKVAVVVKLTLEGMREKEKRCHLSKVRSCMMARLAVVTAPSVAGREVMWSRAGDKQSSGSR